MEAMLKEAKRIIQIRQRGLEILRLRKLVAALETAIESGWQSKIAEASQALEEVMVKDHYYDHTRRRMQQLQNCDEYGNPIEWCED